MDTQQKTSFSSSILTSDTTSTEVAGPIAFTQGNAAHSDSGRLPSNLRFDQVVGHPEADLSKQVERWFPVNKVNWTVTQMPGTAVTVIDTPAMMAAAQPYFDVAQYYRQQRISPVLRVTLAGNAAQIGQLIVIFRPSGVLQNQVNIDYPSLLPYAFVRPHDSAACEVEGNYVKHLRSDDQTYHPLDFGTFYIIVMNSLLSPATTPQQVTIATYVKFSHVSVRVYIPPTVTDTKRRLDYLIKQLPAEEQKNYRATEKGLVDSGLSVVGKVPAVYNGIQTILNKFGVEGAKPGKGMDKAGSVLSVVGRVADIGRPLYKVGSSLFHAPPRPQSVEWSVADKPRMVARMQYNSEQLCAPDLSVAQLPGAFDLMDVVSFIKQPYRMTEFNWTDTQAAGTVLLTVPMDPYGNLALNRSPYFTQLPSFWRGSVTVKIQFIKNIFHKGQVLIQLLPKGVAPATDNSQFGMTEIFDISDKDTYEVTLPWAYNLDYVTQDFGQLFYLSVSVLCMLQTTNTVSQVKANVWLSAGEDFQMIGGPSMDQIKLATVIAEPRETPKEKGDAHPVDTIPSGATPDYTEQQEENTHVQPPIGKATDMMPSNPLEPQQTHPMYNTQAEPMAGWLPMHQSSLKLAAHRPQDLLFTTGSWVVGPLSGTYTPESGTLLFTASQADLLRALPQSAWFAYISGGVTLTWTTTATKLTPGYLRVEVQCSEGSIRYQHFPLCENIMRTIEVPWIQQTPAVPVRYNPLIHQDAQELDQMISVYLYTDSTSDWWDPTTSLRFNIGAADDYMGQQPVMPQPPGLKGTINMYKGPAPPTKRKTPREKGLETDPETAVLEPLLPTHPFLPEFNSQKTKYGTFDSTIQQQLSDIEQQVQHVKDIFETAPPAVTTNQLEQVIGKVQVVKNNLGALNKRQKKLLNKTKTLAKDVEKKLTEQDFPSKSDGLKTIIFEDLEETGHQTHCCTRKQVVVTFPDFTKLSVPPKRVNHITESFSGYGRVWWHWHTQTICFRTLKQYGVHDNHQIQTFCGKVTRAYETPVEEVLYIPFKESKSWTAPCRMFKRKSTYWYYTHFQDKLYRTSTPKPTKPWLVWGNVKPEQTQQREIPTEKGKMWEWFSQQVDSKVTLHAETTAKKIVEEAKTNLQTITEVGDLKDVGELLMLKIMAYATSMLNATTLTSWISIATHVLCDVQVFYLKHGIIGTLVKQISSYVPEFLHLFWVPEEDETKEKGFVDTTQEILFVFRKIFEGSFGFVVDGAKHLTDVLKKLNLLGGAVRGAQSCINGLKALFEWLGLTITDTKKKLKQCQELLHREDVVRDLSEMGTCMSYAPQEFGSKGAQLRRLRKTATEVLTLTAGVRDPVIDTIRVIAQEFKKHTELASGIVTGVVDFEPVFVLLSGPPEKGKSVFGGKLARSLTKALGREPENFYACNLEQDHWDGYKDQPVGFMDDLFQDPKGENVAFLTQLISSIPTPLPMADLQSKGALSSLRIIIATTNVEVIKGEWVTDPEAIIRRYARTHYMAIDNDKFQKVVWKRDPMTHKFTKTLGEVLGYNEVCREVWDEYERKFQKHMEMKSENLFALKPLSDSFMCPEVTITKKAQIRQLPPYTVLRRKIDYTTIEPQTIKGNALVLNGKDLADALWDLEERNAGKEIKERKEHDLDLYWDLMFPTYERVLVMRAYGLPYYDTTAVEGRVFFLASPQQIRRELAKLDDEHLKAFLRWAVVQGCDSTYVADLLPFRNAALGAVDRALQALKNHKKIVLAAGLLVGTLLGALTLTYMFRSSTEKGRYQGASAQRQVRTMMRPVAHERGLEDKTPIIEKAMARWKMTTPTGGVIEVNALFIGGNYLITNTHAVRPGQMHTVVHKMNAVDVMEIPIHITETNIVRVEAHGVIQDLTMVYLGSQVPNKRDLMNYFITEDSYQSLQEGPAQVLLHSKDCALPVTTTQRFETNVKTKTMVGQTRWRDVFRAPFYAEDGTCGSPMLTLEKSRDTRIIGLLTSGNSTESFFTPVTKELLQDMKNQLETFSQNVPIESNEGIFDKIEVREKAVVLRERKAFHSAKGLVEYPELIEPVHTEIEPLSQQTVVPINMNCSYEPCLNPNYVTVEEGCFLNKTKVPAMRSLHNVEITLPLNLGGIRKVPGDQFTVERKPLDMDGLLLESVLNMLETKYAKSMKNLRVLTNDEALSGYEEYNDRIHIENQGMNLSTAIGLTSKLEGFGNKKRDVVNIVSEGRVFKQTFVEKLEQVEEQLAQGTYEPRIMILNLKDELRTEAKTKQGKVRLFCIDDMVDIVLSIKYFGHFFDHFRALGLDSWHTLGQDPVNLWNELADYLGTPVLAGDGKNWDMSLQSVHFELMRRLIEKVYQRAPGSKLEKQRAARIRLGLLQHLAFSVTTYAGKQFLSTGLKSGDYATTEKNTLIQIILVCYTVVKICIYNKNQSLPKALEVARNHRFVCNGDDNLHSEPQFCTQQEYSLELKNTFLDCGIELTPSSKVGNSLYFEDISNAEYLKRTFHKDGQWFYPAISNDTISGLVNYHRKSTTELENLREAARFLRQARDYRNLKLLTFYVLMVFPEQRFQDWTWDVLADEYNAPMHDKRPPSDDFSCPNADHLLPLLTMPIDHCRIAAHFYQISRREYLHIYLQRLENFFMPGFDKPNLIEYRTVDGLDIMQDTFVSVYNAFMGAREEGQTIQSLLRCLEGFMVVKEYKAENASLDLDTDKAAEWRQYLEDLTFSEPYTEGIVQYAQEVWSIDGTNGEFFFHFINKHSQSESIKRTFEQMQGTPMNQETLRNVLWMLLRSQHFVKAEDWLKTGQIWELDHQTALAIRAGALAEEDWEDLNQNIPPE